MESGLIVFFILSSFFLSVAVSLKPRSDHAPLIVGACPRQAPITMAALPDRLHPAAPAPHARSAEGGRRRVVGRWRRGEVVGVCVARRSEPGELDNEDCAHYVVVSKIQWKPFCPATQIYAQNAWPGWQCRVKNNELAQAPI